MQDHPIPRPIAFEPPGLLARGQVIAALCLGAGLSLGLLRLGAHEAWPGVLIWIVLALAWGGAIAALILLRPGELILDERGITLLGRSKQALPWNTIRRVSEGLFDSVRLSDAEGRGITLRQRPRYDELLELIERCVPPRALPKLFPEARLLNTPAVVSAAAWGLGGAVILLIFAALPKGQPMLALFSPLPAALSFVLTFLRRPLFHQLDPRGITARFHFWSRRVDFDELADVALETVVTYRTLTGEAWTRRDRMSPILRLHIQATLNNRQVVDLGPTAHPLTLYSHLRRLIERRQERSSAPPPGAVELRVQPKARPRQRPSSQDRGRA